MVFNNKRLVIARKMKGYSLQELANVLTEKGYPITKQALQKYEAGTFKPNSKMYNALLEVLEVRPDFFEPVGDIKIEFGEIHAFKDGKTVKW